LILPAAAATATEAAEATRRSLPRFDPPDLDLPRRLARRAGIEDLAERVLAGERLSSEEGVRLYGADLLAVGALANFVRERLWGPVAFFNVNQHVNYTNVCNKLCRFCAFQRLPNEAGAYVFSPEQAAAKIRAHLDEPVTEVHMVAGIDPRLPYGYYLDLLRAVKAARPEIHVKAFTMVEIEQIQKVAKKPLPEVFADLKAAGLGSLPGGGAEIFAERVHREMFRMKIGAERWLEIARQAHCAGLRSNCTMLYGHIETVEERVDHLLRLRSLQDETGGFQTFIPLAFHPENTEMAHVKPPTGADDLRALAVSRLLLDNVPHVKAYWIMLGIPIAQMGLSFGADDIDGTVVEEKIYHEAGATTPQGLSRDDLLRLCRDAGRLPVERDTLYDVVRVDA
jgi:aminodeoxyfutalosine synthase